MKDMKDTDRNWWLLVTRLLLLRVKDVARCAQFNELLKML